MRWAQFGRFGHGVAALPLVVLVAGGGTALAETAALPTGIQIQLEPWVTPIDPVSGWIGVSLAGEGSDKLVATTTDINQPLLVPPGSYDVWWRQAAHNDAVKIVSTRVNAPFGGVGLDLNGVDNTFEILRVVPDSPGDRAGILPHDVVVAIDGDPVRGLALADVVGKLRGAPASPVTIGVERAGKRMDFPVVRNTIAIFTRARVATGVNPVLAEGVTPLAADGWWGLAPPWGDEDKVDLRMVGKVAPMVTDFGLYSLWWKADGASEPVLKVRATFVFPGRLTNIPVGTETLAPKTSAMTVFRMSSENGSNSAQDGYFPANTTSVEAHYQWKDSPVGRHFSVVWSKDGKTLLDEGGPVGAPSGGETSRLAAPEGGTLEPGFYFVQVMEDGDLRWQSGFTIRVAR